MKLRDLLNENEENPAKPPFILPDLGFDEGAISSFANEETMRLHREVHHQGYIDGLNAAIKKYPVLKAKTPAQMFDMLRNKELVGEAKEAVEKFCGGHINHSLFWQMLTPKNTSPSPNLEASIARDFGSMDDFKAAFERVASEIFGSGWAWLIYEPDIDGLSVMTTTNQRNPAMTKPAAIMLLGLDLWEHAFYLTHRADKTKYMKAFWKVVNWNHVSRVYENSTK